VGFLGVLCQTALNVSSLILKRAALSRPSGEWNDDESSLACAPPPWRRRAVDAAHVDISRWRYQALT
jgi:hypothetical protein